MKLPKNGGLNNYEKEVMYDGSGDADDVFLFT